MNPIEKRIAEVLECMALTDGIITKDEAEQIVQRCQIKGLTVEDIIEGNTPKSIAEHWMHRRMSTPVIQAENTADCKHYPLLPFSKVVFDDDASRWTFPITLRAKEDEVDAKRLEQAVERVLSHHPIFSMHIEDDGTHWYDPSYRSPYIKTEVKSLDGYVYLSLTLNRILGDATSFVLFAQNIWRAYRGEDLPYDGYLHYLKECEQQSHTREYMEHAEWLACQYETPAYPLLPNQDSPEGLLPNRVSIPLIIQPDYSERLMTFSQREHISINAFYCLVSALAIMDYNNTDEAGLTWAYLGRETRQQMTIFGSLHRDIPMRLTRHCTATVTDSTTEPDFHLLFAQLREQMLQGILHSDYPFTLLSPKYSPWHTALNVLVQPSLTEAFDGCPVHFELVPAEPSNGHSAKQLYGHSAEQSYEPSVESYCMLDIDITQTPLTLTFNYSPRHYTEQSIQRFATLISQNALLLLSKD